MSLGAAQPSAFVAFSCRNNKFASCGTHPTISYHSLPSPCLFGPPRAVQEYEWPLRACRNVLSTANIVVHTGATRATTAPQMALTAEMRPVCVARGKDAGSDVTFLRFRPMRSTVRILLVSMALSTWLLAPVRNFPKVLHTRVNTSMLSTVMRPHCWEVVSALLRFVFCFRGRL